MSIEFSINERLSGIRINACINETDQIVQKERGVIMTKKTIKILLWSVVVIIVLMVAFAIIGGVALFN